MKTRILIITLICTFNFNCYSQVRRAAKTNTKEVNTLIDTKLVTEDYAKRGGYAPDRVAIIDNSGYLTYSSLITTTQLSRLQGVSSPIQDQLDDKAEIESGSSGNHALYLNTSGRVQTHNSVSYNELGYLDGVTSSIQTQINNKAKHSGWTSSRVMISDASGNLSVSKITKTELEYLDGITNYACQKSGTWADERVLLSDGTAGKIKVSSMSKTELDELSTAFNYTGDNTMHVETVKSDAQNLFLKNTNNNSVYMSGSGNFRPSSNGSQHLGSSSERWNSCYISGSWDKSSDKRLKKEIKPIPDTLVAVWLDYVKPKSYRLRKNDKLINIGYIAQDVIKAFDMCGLDWRKYNVVLGMENRGEGEKDKYYSLDYTACHIIEMAAIRRKIIAQK